jgi:hypothetical protein
MGLLNFENKDNTFHRNVKTTPPTTELSSHRPEPSATTDSEPNTSHTKDAFRYITHVI